MAELVTEYLEGSLDQRKRIRFEDHLSNCQGCPAYLEQLRVVLRALGRITDEDLDPVFRRRLLDALDGTAGTW